MNESRPTSSSGRRCRSRGRLHPDISRGTSLPKTIYTDSRWVYDRTHTSRGRSRLEAFPKPYGRGVSGQLPLAIAQLLIEWVPALRATSNNDATAMAPVLHTSASQCLPIITGNIGSDLLKVGTVTTSSLSTVRHPYRPPAARAIDYFGMSICHFGSPSVEHKEALPKTQLLSGRCAFGWALSACCLTVRAVQTESPTRYIYIYCPMCLRRKKDIKHNHNNR